MGRDVAILDHLGRVVEWVQEASPDRPFLGGTKGTWGQEMVSGYIRDPAEYNLKWEYPRTRNDLIQRIVRRDSTVRAALNLRMLPILRAAASFSPPKDASSAEGKATEWLQEVFVDSPGTPFRRVGAWALKAIHDGMSTIEGSFDDIDGRVTPVKWEYRSSTSIVKAGTPFVLSDDGDLIGINQTSNAVQGRRRPETMDIQNVMHFVYDNEGSPYGNSALRGIFRDEDLLDMAQKNEAIAIMRYAVPVPKGRLDPKKNYGKKEKDQFKKMLSLVRSHHKGAIVLEGDEQADIMVSGDSNRVNAHQSIRRYKEGIALAMNVPFMLLGQSGAGGSYNLADGQIDAYLGILESDAEWLADTIVMQMAAPLVWWNFGVTRCPRLSFGSMTARSLKEIAVIVQQLVQAKVIRSTPQLELWLYEKLGSPTDDILAQQEQDRQDEAEAKEREAAGGGTGLPGEGGEPDPAADPSDDGDDGGGDGGSRAGRLPRELAAGDTERIKERADQAKSDPDLVYSHRDFTEPEKFVSWKVIDGEMDNGVDRAVDVTAAFRERAVDEIDRQLREVVGEGDIPGVKGIRVSDEVRRDMAAGLKRVIAETMEAGRRAVRTELNRQDEALLCGPQMAVMLQRDDIPGEFICGFLDHRIAELRVSGERQFIDEDKPPQDPENAEALAQLQADRMVERAIVPLEEAAQDEAERMLQSGGTLAGAPEEAFDNFREGLVGRSLDVVAVTAGFHIPQAFNTGRQQAIDQEQDESGQAFVAQNATLLDGNVCEPCLAAESFSIAQLLSGSMDVGSAGQIDLAPPLKDNGITGEGCRGKGRCRCIQVFQKKDRAVALNPV